MGGALFQLAIVNCKVLKESDERTQGKSSRPDPNALQHRGSQAVCTAGFHEKRRKRHHVMKEKPLSTHADPYSLFLPSNLRTRSLGLSKHRSGCGLAWARFLSFNPSAWNSSISDPSQSKRRPRRQAAKVHEMWPSENRSRLLKASLSS